MHFFSFVFANLHHYPAFWGRAYLASYLAFLPKSRHFCPKTGDSASFRTYIIFRWLISVFSTSIAQNQRTKQPALTLVITIMPFRRLTRNRFVLNRARGFESHHLRQQKAPAQAGAFFAAKMVRMRTGRRSADRKQSALRAVA